MEDDIVWTLSDSCKCTTQSAYMGMKVQKSEVEWHRLVWGRMVVPRHSFTLWQLLAGNLPTQDRLVRKNVLTNSKCCFCGCSRENSKHLFFSCSYTSKIWEEIKAVLGINSPSSDVNREWRYLFQLGKAVTTAAEIKKSIIAATVSYIWRERNYRRFRGAEQPWDIVKNRILRDMAVYIQTQVDTVKDGDDIRGIAHRLGLSIKYKNKTIIPCQWTKPASGNFKLNTDGSVELNRYGYGGAIRDDKGRPIMLYFGSEGHDSVIYQELMAILKGVQCCVQMGLHRVEIATDSLRAVQLVREKEAPPWKCRKLLNEIADEMKKLEFTSIKHVYRETNRLADCLSKYADCNMICNYVNPPISQELDLIVREDISQVYHRLR